MEKTESKISAKKKKTYETPKAESESVDKLASVNSASCGAE
jgi:hypothetical protein